MSAEIPFEIAKAIARLRADAQEKTRLADELYRNYTGQDPKQGFMDASNGIHGLRGETPAAVTTETLIQHVGKKNARVFQLAKQYNISPDRVKELVAASGGKLTIPDWRGWVKLSKHK